MGVKIMVRILQLFSINAQHDETVLEFKTEDPSFKIRYTYCLLEKKSSGKKSMTFEF